MRAPLVSLIMLATATLPETAAGQSITPKFAWPAGSRAETVTTQRLSMSGTGGGTSLSDSSGMRLVGHLEVRPHAEGLQILTVIDKVEATGGAAAGAVQNAVKAGTSSDLIVTTGGAFVRLTDAAAMKRQADSAAAPMLAQLRAMAPAMAAKAEEATSIGALTRASAESWKEQVSGVLSRSWAPKDSVVDTQAMPMPLSPTGTVSIPRVLRYGGVVPCPASQAGTCWEFTSRAVMSREVLKGPMLEMLKSMGAPESAIDQLPIPESTTTTTTIYEAATMRPLRTETTVTGGGSGAAMMMVMGSTTVMTYTWR